MPIIGIVASSQADVGAFDAIASTVVGVGGSSLIEFPNIPATYKHLRLHITARSTRPDAGGDLLDVRFNDATSSYWDHLLRSQAGTMSSDQNLNSQNHIDLARVAGATAASNVFSAFVIDITDYANTSKVKSLMYKSGLAGESADPANQVVLGSAFWGSTTAINKISIRTSYALSFVQNSTFALYGWKG